MKSQAKKAPVKKEAAEPAEKVALTTPDKETPAQDAAR
jgi:hypothetical protein